MNIKERTYRFDELITTIALLPELEDDEDGAKSAQSDWYFPNLTLGLSNSDLYSALICQAMKGDSDFRFKMCATLSNSALKHINETDKPSKDDMTALAISANILWASGVASALFQTMGLIGHLCGEHDVELPDLATAFLAGNNHVEVFGELDPYELLKGHLDRDKVLRIIRGDIKD